MLIIDRECRAIVNAVIHTESVTTAPAATALAQVTFAADRDNRSRSRERRSRGRRRSRNRQGATNGKLACVIWGYGDISNM